MICMKGWTDPGFGDWQSSEAWHPRGRYIRGVFAISQSREASTLYVHCMYVRGYCIPKQREIASVKEGLKKVKQLAG